MELWSHESVLKIKKSILESVTAIAVTVFVQNVSILTDLIGGFVEMLLLWHVTASFLQLKFMKKRENS